MNIVVLENEPSSFRGGQERSLIDACEGLASRGHSVSLLYIKEGNLLERYRKICDAIIKVDGYFINSKNNLSSLISFINDVLKVPTRSDTIVYSNQYHDSLFGAAVSFLKNVPYVCHLRLPPPETFCKQWEIGLKGVDRFITISEKTQQDWDESGVNKSKVDVVYNGINTETFTPSNYPSPLREELGISQQAKVISYVGRLDREKGVEILINAFSQLIDHQDYNPESTFLLIAGKPLCHQDEVAGQHYVNSLKNLAVSLGITSTVKFLGHLNETTPLFQASDVSVLPSLHSEPFGRSIIESMACGTPAIASRTGGIPEILTGEFTQCLFSPGNSADLASTMDHILSMVDADPAFKKRCRQHTCEHFSTTQMVDGIDKVLLKVIQNRS
ncbi:MAG: glycosyltransferase family 4 protein [Phormidesmis sp.]